jgi:putative ABC transport system permease protein
MKEIKPYPPRIFLRFFRWYCRPRLADHIEGDLIEVYRKRVQNNGKRNADIRFVIDVLRLFRPGIIRPAEGYKNLHNYGMFKSYFKIGWRNLAQNKLFSAIKILGLSIGLSVCMLIFLYTKDEISYDQFHENRERIFRVVQAWHFNDDAPMAIGITNAIVGESFGREIPEVQQFVRVNGVAVTIIKDNELFTENPLFVDDNFFDVFTFPLLAGDATTALKDPHGLVLSGDLAEKYFGTRDVIGKTMQLKLGDKVDSFTITALTDSAPENSTMQIEMLLPFQYFEKNYNNNIGWIGGSLNTFLVLNRGADLRAVTAKMQTLFDKNTMEDLAERQAAQGTTLKIDMGLQALTDIHLSTNLGPDNGMTGGSKPIYSYVLSGIAAFILLIACINFINLAVGQSLKRGKEIGIRKVVGSSRYDLALLFLVESFLVSAIAFGLAIVFTTTCLPLFNELANKELSLSYLSDTYLYSGFAILLVISSVLAGFYPSLVLSAFKPVKVLYGRQKLMGKNYFVRSLIVLQFALATFLIIGTIVINSQVNFLSRADLGYDGRNLVCINIPVSKSSDRLPALFKNMLTGKKNIIGVAARHAGRSTSAVKVHGNVIEIENNKIDDQFFPTFKIPVISGRNFSPEFSGDSVHSVIVNESFIEKAGWSPEEAIGKAVYQLDEKKPSRTIVGVIRNYHFESLREKIKPALFSMNPEFNFGQIWVKINPEKLPETLRMLESTYKDLVQLYPYRYDFMDDINAANYKTEAKLKQIIFIASALFIFISCIGLFGLTILSIEQRTKEIGIRKVLGAAITTIVSLITKDFSRLVFVAFVIALPAGYFVLKLWLESFAYRIELGWWMFSLAGLLVITVALLVVGLQAIKAAMANPVRNLRSE